ncbi:MAG: hypothetical protein CM15mP115_18200 [Alphaproteobacteria bacterium]|nr:MAG: hypothetical protein CM15mP115_18200 [Alphaproteobacteria bacterium]
MGAERRRIGKAVIAGPDFERQAGAHEKGLDLRQGKSGCIAHGGHPAKARRPRSSPKAVRPVFTASGEMPIS